ncbi:MAG: hypothetical protein Q4E73_07415 [Lachnospiraceae bacterium]|nr:hypothetical protein [Lachnospiraceae bacterium]
MKLGIETMIHMIIFLIGFIFVISVYMISLESADAKQYHAWTMEKLEGAKYAKAVQEYCMKDAQEHGYTLKIEEEAERKRNDKKVILDYHLSVPFLETGKSYQIVGYSH